jgi:hypothetical protein
MLFAVLLGVLAEANAGAVNDMVRLFAGRFATAHSQESFFAGALLFYYGLPKWLTTAAAVLFRIGVGCLAFLFKPGAVKQGGGYVMVKPMLTIGNGVAGYCVIMALVLLFTMSVSGVLLSFALLALLWLITILGEASLGLLAGYMLFDSFHVKSSNLSYMCVGMLGVEILRCLPILGYAVGMFLLPVISVGICFTLIYEGYLRKNFLHLPFWNEPAAERRASTRDIIMKGIDRTSNEDDEDTGNRDVM